MLLTTRLNAINTRIEAYLAEIAALQLKVTQLQAHAQEVQGVDQSCESALIQIGTAIAMLQDMCPEEITTFKQAIDALFCAAPLPQLTLTGSDEASNEQVEIHIPSPGQEEILRIIRRLDQELGTENYLPIFRLRQELSGLNRSQVDNILYSLQKAGLIELDTLQEANAYTPEEIDAGIPQNIGGSLFFITVTVAPTTVIDVPVSEVQDEVQDFAPQDQNFASYEELKQCDRPALIKLANKYKLTSYKNKTRDVLAKTLVGKVLVEELR